MSMTLRVSHLKGTGRGAVHALPREGSVARRIYDRLHESPGRMVHIGDLTGLNKRAIADLQDYYGCDIRCFRRDKISLYVLCGEWKGSVYVDHVAAAYAEVAAA